MLPPVSPSGSTGSADQPANPIASDASRDGDNHNTLAQSEPAAVLGGLRPLPKSDDLQAMSETLDVLFPEAIRSSRLPRSVAAQALRLDVFSSALPVLPQRVRPAMARHLGNAIHDLPSPKHQGKALRSLVDEGLCVAPDTIVHSVLRTLPGIPEEDKAALIEAIVSNPHCLSHVPHRADEHRTITRIFDSIHTLPDSYQFDLLALLLRNAKLFTRTYLPEVVSLRGRIIGVMQELARKPGTVASVSSTAPQSGLPEVVESLFGGIESPADQLSPRSDSAADRVAALCATAPSGLELTDSGDRSNKLSKALSEHLLDRILALDEPNHRFAALCLLVSKPEDTPVLADTLAEQPLSYRGELFELLGSEQRSPSRGKLLDGRALTRIVDAIPALPSPYQSVLLEKIVPACINEGDRSEKTIMINRILALLPGMDLEDRAAPLAKLVSSRPIELLKPADRRHIARAIGDAVFEQGPTQPPQLLSDFAAKVVSDLAPSLERDFMDEIALFLRASPRDFRRAQAKNLLLARAVPWYMNDRLRSLLL